MKRLVLCIIVLTWVQLNKSNPAISIGPHTSKHVGSMKNYMESFIRTILPTNDNSSYEPNVILNSNFY